MDVGVMTVVDDFTGVAVAGAVVAAELSQLASASAPNNRIMAMRQLRPIMRERRTSYLLVAPARAG